MNDSYLGATGANGAGRPGAPARRGARIARKRVIAALILTALTVGCASGCHAVVLNTKPAPHSSTTGR